MLHSAPARFRQTKYDYNNNHAHNQQWLDPIVRTTTARAYPSKRSSKKWLKQFQKLVLTNKRKLSILFMIISLIAIVLRRVRSSDNSDTNNTNTNTNDYDGAHHRSRGFDGNANKKSLMISFEEKSVHREAAADGNLCIFMDEEIVGKDVEMNKISGLMRIFQEEYEHVSAIVSVGSTDTFDVDGFQKALFAPSRLSFGAQEPIKRDFLTTEILKMSTIDSNSAMKRRSHAAFMRLSDRFSERKCDVGHFLQPLLAHYSVLARRQRIALKDVPIIVHRILPLETDLDTLNKAWLGSDTVRNMIEKEYIDAVVSSSADVLIFDDEYIATAESKRRLNSLGGDSSFPKGLIGRLIGSSSSSTSNSGEIFVDALESKYFNLAKALVLPLLSSPDSRFARSKQEKNNDELNPLARKKVKRFVFWGNFDKGEGLASFLDVLVRVLEKRKPSVASGKSDLEPIEVEFRGQNSAYDVDEITIHGHVGKMEKGTEKIASFLATYKSEEIIGSLFDNEVIEEDDDADGHFYRRTIEHFANDDDSVISAKDVAKSSAAIVVVFPPTHNSSIYFARESLKIKELISANAPFLASNAALDRAQIFDETMRARVSYGDDSIHDCAETILRVFDRRVGEGGGVYRPDADTSAPFAKKFDQSIERKWIGLHRAIKKRKSALLPLPPASRHPSPRVSIVLVHKDRPKILLDSVASHLAQDYDKVDLIVIDNGSRKTPEATEVLSTIETLLVNREKESNPHRNMYRLMRLPSATSLSGARNIGLKSTRGEYVLFADDDNLAISTQVSILVTAILASSADAIAPGNAYFLSGTSNDIIIDLKKSAFMNKFEMGGFFPLGASTSLGVLEDVYGDANALYRKKAIENVGGWEEMPGNDAAGEDWSLLAKIALAKNSLGVTVAPLATFFYRIDSVGSLAKTSQRFDYRSRTLLPYEKNDVVQSIGLGSVLKYARIGRDALEDAKTSHKKEIERFRSKVSAICASFTNDLAKKSENKIINGGFETETGGYVDAWLGFEKGFDWRNPQNRKNRIRIGGLFDDESSSGDDASTYGALILRNNAVGESRGARQVVEFSNAQALYVSASAFSVYDEALKLYRSDPFNYPSPQSKNYALYIDLEHTDGTSTYGYTLGFPAYKMWTKREGMIISKPVLKAHVYVLFRDRVGKVMFDDVVVRELVKDDVCGNGAIVLENIAPTS